VRRTSPGVRTYDAWALPTAKPDKWFPLITFVGSRCGAVVYVQPILADPFDSKGISRSRLLIASKIAVEFKREEEVVFIRGYVAYDTLVRAPRPTRDGR